jgi:hypothetical protein
MQSPPTYPDALYRNYNWQTSPSFSKPSKVTITYLRTYWLTCVTIISDVRGNFSVIIEENQGLKVTT